MSDNQTAAWETAAITAWKKEEYIYHLPRLPKALISWNNDVTIFCLPTDITTQQEHKIYNTDSF